MKRTLLAIACLIATGTPSVGVSAATQTSSVQVSLNITAACSSFTTTALNFGTSPAVYTPSLTGTASVTSTCTTGTPYKVLLNGGTHEAAGFRYMASGPTLSRPYGLYQDQGLSLPWGDDNATYNAPSVSGTGNGNAQPLTIYGQTSVGSGDPTGMFTDTVTATLSF